MENTITKDAAIFLTPEQNTAVQSIIEWKQSNRQMFVLGGYAGTGKTTLAKRISQKLGGVFCAYTAKAASVLQSKGLEACTIHSLLYDYAGRDEHTGELIWNLKNGESGSFLIVDEYSMVGKKILNDLKEKFPKILFLGDPAQLPPIGENAQIIQPDITLSKIHRQAADSPIIKWAHKVREGLTFNNFQKEIDDQGQFIVKRKEDLTDDELMSADQIITATHKDRIKINQYMRGLYGYSDISNIPVRGERLIICQNNNKEGLINGKQFICQRNAQDWDIERGAFRMPYNGQDFMFWDGLVLGKSRDKYNYYSRLELVDYAYAITCHSSQGSEYGSVIVINGWSSHKQQWLYTAITRGKNKVTVAI